MVKHVAESLVPIILAKMGHEPWHQIVNSNSHRTFYIDENRPNKEVCSLCNCSQRDLTMEMRCPVTARALCG